MNRIKISKKQFFVFLVIAYSLTWVLQIIAYAFSKNGNVIVNSVANMLVMFMPLLGVLIARIPLKGMGWVPHLKGRVRYIFFALWMPILLGIIGAVLYYVIFPDAFNLEFSGYRWQLEQAGELEQLEVQLEAQGMTMPMYMLVSLIGAVTYGPIVNMFTAIGEEVGWRGAMYPYLKEKLGVTKGRILGGTIWGIWHWPMMILTGYEYGKEYLGAPVLGPIVFCLSTIAMGILIDYVYEKTETIWLPTLMHGALNCLTVIAFSYNQEYADRTILGPSYIGMIGMIPMLIVAVLICVKKKRSDAKQDGVEGTCSL